MATRTEFLQNLETTHSWHNWRLGCRQAWCVNYGIRLAPGCKLERARTLAGQPCPKSSVDLVSLGVHITHGFVFLGVMKGWWCRCGLTLKMHARETAWLRSARGCRAYWFPDFSFAVFFSKKCLCAQKTLYTGIADADHSLDTDSLAWRPSSLCMQTPFHFSPHPSGMLSLSSIPLGPTATLLPGDYKIAQHRGPEHMRRAV